MKILFGLHSYIDFISRFQSDYHVIGRNIC